MTPDEACYKLADYCKRNNGMPRNRYAVITVEEGIIYTLELMLKMIYTTPEKGWDEYFNRLENNPIVTFYN